MINKEEALKKLKEMHKEEIEDHKKYMEMAEMIDEAHMSVTANILQDIAHDEETHIRILERIIAREESQL